MLRVTNPFSFALPHSGYFAYLDALIDLLNQDPQFNAFYSTASDYVAAKLEATKSLPAILSDFMPYNDDAAGHNLWTVSAVAG